MSNKNRFLLLSLTLTFIVVIVFFTQKLSAQTSSQVINFIYDAAGQRLAKNVEGGDHTYYLSQGVEVIIHPDNTFDWRKNYSFGGQLVAIRTSDNSATPSATPTP